MLDFGARLLCLQLCLTMTTLRPLRCMAWALRYLTGRVTRLRSASGTSPRASSRPVQPGCTTPIPWAQVRWRFFRQQLFQPDDVNLLAGDAVVVTTGGKPTSGRDRGCSRMSQRAVPGGAGCGVALGNTTAPRACPSAWTKACARRQHKRPVKPQPPAHDAGACPLRPPQGSLRTVAQGETPRRPPTDCPGDLVGRATGQPCARGCSAHPCRGPCPASWCRRPHVRPGPAPARAGAPRRRAAQVTALALPTGHAISHAVRYSPPGQHVCGPGPGTAPPMPTNSTNFSNAASSRRKNVPIAILPFHAPSRRPTAMTGAWSAWRGSRPRGASSALGRPSRGFACLHRLRCIRNGGIRGCTRTLIYAICRDL